jgi:adenylate kinase
VNILMVAPPGAGKGTQAKRLAEHYGLAHLASGDLLRHEMAVGSDIGKAAAEYVERGDLVPDELVLRLVLDRAFVAAKQGGGYVLDGFPRNRGQAKEAYAMTGGDEELRLDAVIHLEVAREELRRRMLARASADGRTDDRASVIDHRLEVYDRQTEPLLEYYRDRRLLVSVDGERPVDEVTRLLIAALNGVRAEAPTGPGPSGPRQDA